MIFAISYFINQNKKKPVQYPAFFIVQKLDRLRGFHAVLIFLLFGFLPD